MRVQLQASPFVPPCSNYLLTERVTILSIIEKCNDMEWAKDVLQVRLNGVLIPNCWWQYVTVKPEAEGLLAMCIVQGNGKILPILASVALIALTAGIGVFGIPFLGIAAGSFASSAIAAGVGIAGQLAINAVTAPPSVRKAASPESGGQRLSSHAGITANQTQPLELLPTLHGKMIVSPSILAPPYTTLNDGVVTVNAIVGIQGRNFFGKKLINGIEISLIEGITYEEREGGPGDAVLTIAQLTCIQQRANVTISNFVTDTKTNREDRLLDQVIPANSDPEFHSFKTDGSADEIWLRFLFPSGIVETKTVVDAMVPLRISIRKFGDVAWINLPTLHITDDKKASGPLLVEVKLKFTRINGVEHYSLSINEFPIYLAMAKTASGQAFEYNADAYFNTSALTTAIPVMTGPTTSGVTMSASSEDGGIHLAWMAAGAGFWAPTINSLPAWLKVDFGSGTTIKSYRFIPQTSHNYSPSSWIIQGSNDNVTWNDLDTVVQTPAKESNTDPITGYIAAPASYQYYRLYTSANNGAADNAIRINTFELFTGDLDSTKSSNGADAGLGKYVGLTVDGAEIFLDPASFPKGIYEVRVRRGIAVTLSDFVGTSAAYTYKTVAANADFFEYHIDSNDFYVVRDPQKDYRSELQMEVFSTVANEVPVDTTGICCIAIALKNTEIKSISAELTSYARIWSGGVWTDVEEPTSNPAALYRRLLMGHAHPNPQPSELINDEVLSNWYDNCVVNGYECNYLQQGGTVADVKSVIAYTGWASPQESEKIGIIEDNDRSAEPIGQMLSPLNSRMLGEVFPLPDIEHGIIAEYLDEDNEYKIARTIIYRAGYNALNATVFITVNYEGFTNLAKVTQRAEFDMLQAILRAPTVQVEVDIEGYTLTRGKLVGHTDDVIDQHNHYALIKAINLSGSNVVSIEVNNIIPFNEMLAGLDVDLDGIDPTNPFGAAIRLANATSTVKVITNTTDSSTITFLTPFAMAGSGLVVKQMVAFGIVGKEYRRMIVVGSKPSGIDKRVLSLAPEANELFA